MRLSIRAFLFLLLVLGLVSRAQAVPSDADLRALGVGVWVWNLSKCGTPAAMVEKAMDAHLGHVLLKVNDGTKEFRDADLVPGVAKAMKQNGVKVLAWGFSYGHHPEAEAALICRWLDQPNIDGYVFDTEDKMEEASPKDVEALLKAVRVYRDKYWPGKILGFAPFAVATGHSLAYIPLITYTDFIAPQLYWATMKTRTPRKGLMWAYHDWGNLQAQLGISKPILWAGQGYQVKGSWLKEGQIVDWGAITRGYFACSVWDWESLTPQRWDEVKQVAIGRAEKWNDVGTDNEPLPRNTAVPVWFFRWWAAWLASYWEVTTLLLLAFIGLLQHPKLVDKKGHWLLGPIAGILLWPILLAGLLILGSLALLVVGICYGLIYLQKLRTKKARL